MNKKNKGDDLTFEIKSKNGQPSIVYYDVLKGKIKNPTTRSGRLSENVCKAFNRLQEHTEAFELIKSEKKNENIFDTSQ